MLCPRLTSHLTLDSPLELSYPIFVYRLYASIPKCVSPTLLNFLPKLQICRTNCIFFFFPITSLTAPSDISKTSKHVFSWTHNLYVLQARISSNVSPVSTITELKKMSYLNTSSIPIHYKILSTLLLNIFFSSPSSHHILPAFPPSHFAYCNQTNPSKCKSDIVHFPHNIPN